MAFNIIVYKTKSKKKKVDKVLTDAKTLTGLWYDQTSILHPQFKIKHDDDILVKYTYAYIEKFNRYYFIKDRKPEDGVYDRLYLDVDPLMTYKTDILNSTQIIGRQENDFNLYLPDTNIPTTNTELHDIVNFPSTPFNTNSAGTGAISTTSKIITLSVVNSELNE